MIETERLILRGWMESDKLPFHAMCNDPAVMEYLGPVMNVTEIDAAIDRQNGLLDALGHCFWAIERTADRRFLGFCGIKPGPLGTPIEGRMEIGWRLAAEHWGRGYAREAAEACLDWAWQRDAIDGVWAITVEGNRRSWRLMERLGMVRRPDYDFVHPQPGLADWLRPHITYSIGRTS